MGQINKNSQGQIESVTFDFKTVNNVNDPIYLSFERGESAEISNADALDDGGVARRNGYTRVFTGNTHSGWSNGKIAYYVKNGVLTWMSDGVEQSVASVDATRRFVYEQVNDVVVATNGKVYGILDGASFETSFTISSALNFKTTPPAGQCLCFYNGRVYIASGEILYCTDPFNAAQCDTRHMVVGVFGARITMVLRVEGGLFVGTENETFFMAGDDPQSKGFDLIQKAAYGAIFGTGVSIPGQAIGPADRKEVRAMWASTRGVCVGGDGGFFENVTQTYFTFATGAFGASIIRNQDSQVHFLASIGNADAAFNHNAQWQLDVDSSDI